MPEIHSATPADADIGMSSLDDVMSSAVSAIELANSENLNPYRSSSTQEKLRQQELAIEALRHDIEAVERNRDGRIQACEKQRDMIRKLFEDTLARIDKMQAGAQNTADMQIADLNLQISAHSAAISVLSGVSWLSGTPATGDKQPARLSSRAA